MGHPELVIFFVIISFVYASVGFGGGSSYLAVMALYAIPFTDMKLTALICNVVVVTGGTLVFIKKKELPFKQVLPLALLSVPMAYLGARLKISEHTFFLALGSSLLVAGVLLWLKPMPAKEKIGNQNAVVSGAIGGAIGFLSGMVGIGGGIFLSPLLNLMGWDSPRRIAATASFFILINSVAGIAGQLSKPHASVQPIFILALVGAVLVGGQWGSRLGANKFSQLAVRRVTAVLVFVAGCEVLIKHAH